MLLEEIWRAGMTLATYFVLTFGWTGSPGEWMVWAWTAKQFHADHAPQNGHKLAH